MSFTDKYIDDRYSDSFWLRPISMPIRITIILIGVVQPVICHFFTMYGPPQPPTWQSGSFGDKLSHVLSLECGWPMLPLLAFAMACLSMTIYDERQAAASAWVRFGVFTGVPVTAWYVLVFCWTIGPNDVLSGPSAYSVGGVLSLVVFYGIYRGLKQLTVAFGDSFIWICVTLAVVLSVSLPTVVFFPLFISIFFATVWAFVVYSIVSLRIFFLCRRNRFGLAEMIGWVTWISTYIAAIRWSVIMSLNEYSMLPLEEPETCYVATAAAKGDPRIVKSTRLVTTHGTDFLVSQQLATFKAAELTVKTLVPRLHRFVRVIYDRVGPVAAGCLQARWLATFAFLSLKPAEWICRFGLFALLGRDSLRATKLLYFRRASITVSL